MGHKVKLIFVDEPESANEHEATQPEAQEIFRLAEKLSEKELERLAKVVANFRPENIKIS